MAENTETSPPSEAEQDRTLLQWMKLKIADAARLMQDNQRILDTSTAADRAHRDQQYRFRESQMNAPASKGIDYPKDDAMGDIAIDSPVTTTNNNHYHQAPTPAPQAVQSTPVATQQPSMLPAIGNAAKLALATALLGGGGGAGFLVSRYLQPTPPTGEQPAIVSPQGTNTTIEKRTGFLIELVPPKKKE